MEQKNDSLLNKDDIETAKEAELLAGVFSNNENIMKEESFKEKILEKIKEEEVKPRSRLIFLFQEYAIWFLWGSTVFVGALSVAVMMFVGSRQGFAPYELTHKGLLEFAIDVLPVIWIVLFGAMSILAVFNMRHTKRGYRYPLWMIIISSIISSFVLGVLLHLSGVGFSLDKKLGAWSKGYLSQEKMEIKWWQNPEEGRLVGTTITVRESADTGMRFVDISGSTWQVEVDELREKEKSLLLDGMKVRVFGKINTEKPVIHICGVMPWIHDREMKFSEMEEMRSEARGKMEYFRQINTENDEKMSICAEFMQQMPRPPKPAW